MVLRNNNLNNNFKCSVLFVPVISGLCPSVPHGWGVVVTSVPGLNVLWTFIPRNKSDRTEYTGKMCPIGQLIPGMKVWGVGRSVLKDGKIDYVLVIKVLLQCPGYLKLGPVIQDFHY